MNCNDIRELMSLDIDNLLTNEEKDEFERHLSQCDQCKIEYKELIKTVEMLNHIPMKELPKDFNVELRKELEKQKQKRSITSINWKKYGVVAAVFLIGIVSVLQSDLLDNAVNQYGMKSAAPVEEAGMEMARDAEVPAMSQVAEMDIEEDANLYTITTTSDNLAVDDGDIQNKAYILTGRTQEPIEAFGAPMPVEEYIITENQENSETDMEALIAVFEIEKDTENEYIEYIDTFDVKDEVTLANIKTDQFNITLLVKATEFIEIYNELSQFDSIVASNVYKESYILKIDELTNKIEQLESLVEEIREDLKSAEDNTQDSLETEIEANVDRIAKLKSEIGLIEEKLLYDKITIKIYEEN